MHATPSIGEVLVWGETQFRFLNHCDTANLDCGDPEMWARTRRIVVRTTRAIRVGEELTLNYRTTYQNRSDKAFTQFMALCEEFGVVKTPDVF